MAGGQIGLDRPEDTSVPVKKDYPSNNGVLSLAEAWLPVLTVVGGALWGLYTYLDHAKEVAKAQASSERIQAEEAKTQSERESRTRLIEAQKPFLDKQLALYLETAQVVGKLVAIDLEDRPQWYAAQLRFEELYWSELTMVEHSEVASAMGNFRTALQAVLKEIDEVAKAPSGTKTLGMIDRNDLRISALHLAHALRQGIEESWGSGADSTNKIVAPYQK